MMESRIPDALGSADGSGAGAPAGAPPAPLDLVIERATEGLLALQKRDGSWVFELEADATIPAEYVLLTHHLGETADLELERKIGVYLRRVQGTHGGWPLHHDGPFDVSATVKAYFALKMIGDDPDAPHMRKAREALHAHGGAEACNVFTRILLALYGVLSWDAVPQLPVELILLPRWFPIHLSKMSYWSRTVIVPLLVLRTLKPLARNPRGVRVDELFLEPPETIRALRRGAHQKEPWTTGFLELDKLLKRADRHFPKGQRQRAMDKAIAFVDERLNGEDGLGAIYPAMANAVMMYDALGRSPNDPNRAIARRSIEKLLIVGEQEAYCQPCLSPVWDTALVCHALMETRARAAQAAVRRGLDWLKPLQVLDVPGDWAERRPGLAPGGWAFQYANPWYPDLDDTAVVAMAMDRARRRDGGAEYDTAIDRARTWVRGMQSGDGGWAAFDVDNVQHYLNNIPFADHGALLDPPTVDVTARCVSLLAQLGEPRTSQTVARAIDYLRREQAPDGSWFGRWGVNYVYGTWSTLCALAAVGIGPDDPMVRRAVDWLVAVQNPDGGWGESCDSYRLDYTGYRPSPSTASQTAWALLGLMAAGEVFDPAVARGVAWLQGRQNDDGFWPEPHHTGGGFPRVFYLRYHGYAKFFPLWALARWRRLARGERPAAVLGM